MTPTRLGFANVGTPLIAKTPLPFPAAGPLALHLRKSAILQDRADAVELVGGYSADGEEGGNPPGFLVPVVDLPDDAYQSAVGLGDQLPARLDLPGQPLDLAGCEG